MNAFEGIAEFIAVAETQGFSAAARRLGVSTSHVSRRVSALEQRLGCALLARTTRKVRLTEAGVQYYRRCQELVYGLEEADASVTRQQQALTGTLRVSAGGEFAEQYIVPALVEFATQHPSLTVDINFSSRLVDFVEEGIDFSIRYGRLTDSGLVARKLVDRSLMAAASPAYLQQHGTPASPAELARHHCLVSNSDTWLFSSDGNSQEVKVHGRWRSNSGRSIVTACKAGLGIAYMPKASFGSAVSGGALVPILEPYWSSGLTTWIVYANRKYLPARARLAIQFLLRRFNNWQEA